jgi:hypothetical protein
MTTKVPLYQVQPYQQSNSPKLVGHFSLGRIEANGLTDHTTKCLSIEVEANGPEQLLSVTDSKKQQHPPTISWLQLEAVIHPYSIPRQIGRVYIDEKGMLPVDLGKTRSGTWMWEVRSEDIETVEQVRFDQPHAPINFGIDIHGIGKLVDANGRFYDLIAARSRCVPFPIELSHWNRLITELGYSVPPTQASLVGRPTLQHQAWEDAAQRLNEARQHLWCGEDYDALRQALSALEALVSTPYDVKSWRQLLEEMPHQKADGLAKLFSGFATFCNKIGHHRDRSQRDAAGNLTAMPLNHSEANIAVAIAQYILMYPLRLWTEGILTENPSDLNSQTQHDT